MFRFLSIFIFFSFTSTSNAYTLSSPPRESKETGVKLYAPFAKFISKTINSDVKYIAPANWLRYQRSIKRDEYDIVFDGPHLASWRIKHHEHTPLMMLAGNLVFYFITTSDNSLINTPRDFSARKVCVLPPPNLNSLVLLEHLDTLNKEPVIKGIKGNLNKVVSSLLKGHCIGAVVPAGFYENKLSSSQKSMLKIIYKSSPLPNQVITVSSRVPKSDINKLLSALKSKQGLKIINSFSKRFGGNFIPANKDAYKGASHLLEGSLIGWHGKGKKRKGYLLTDKE